MGHKTKTKDSVISGTSSSTVLNTTQIHSNRILAFKFHTDTMRGIMVMNDALKSAGD